MLEILYSGFSMLEIWIMWSDILKNKVGPINNIITITALSGEVEQKQATKFSNEVIFDDFQNGKSGGSLYGLRHH